VVLEDTVATTVTGPETTAAFAGELIEIVGGVELLTLIETAALAAV
jgi:hypothetical protein